MKMKKLLVALLKLQQCFMLCFMIEYRLDLIRNLTGSSQSRPFSYFQTWTSPLDWKTIVMGRKGQNKKTNKKVSDENKNDLKSEDTSEDLFALFQPMAPNKRAELNGIVEQLLNKSSNFTQDDPTTPSKLYAEFEEIYAIVQKIRNIEMQANMNRRLRGPRKMHVKPFLEWLDKYGAKIEGVEIAEFGNQGLGLKVTKELKKGDVVISIPRKVFMSTETAKHSSLSELCEKDQMLQRMPNVSLALHLLVEKNSPASFWEPYINLLPSSYTTVLYFTPDDFKELRGSPALEDALKQFKYVARQYAYFYRKFQSMLLRDYFTFDEYRWAVSTVMTRQNQVSYLNHALYINECRSLLFLSSLFLRFQHQI